MKQPEYQPTRTYKVSRNDYVRGQLEAIDKILEWAHSSIKVKDDLAFTLSGFAGTGKTTIAKDIVKNLRGSIAVTAPTHKAVRIASNTIGVEGSTIQKLLGLRPNTDLESFDVNNPQFDPIGNVYIKNYKYILIDECSMINSALFDTLMAEAYQYKVKLLFIGDPYQLPPVAEHYSRTFSIKHRYNLTEIVRQASDNPLVTLLDIARDSVINKSDRIVQVIDKRKSMYNDRTEQGYVIAKDQHYAELLNDKFTSAEFERNIDFVRYLAFTNEAVLATNQYVRRLLFGNTSQILIQDDLLTSYSTPIDEFNSPIIVNSEDYIIHEIADYNNKYLIKGYLVRLRSVNGGQITNRLFILDHTIQSNLERYITVYFSLLAKAKTAKNPATRRDAWDRFWQYKHYNLLMTDVVTQKKELVAKKAVDYGFGLTVHKSQGSTFDNAFIDANNIIYKKNGQPYYNTNLRNRLLYVALSRARNTAFINY